MSRDVIVCGITQLPISHGTRLGVMVMDMKAWGHGIYPFDFCKPVTPMVFGSWAEGFHPDPGAEEKLVEYGKRVGIENLESDSFLEPIDGDNLFAWYVREDALQMLKGLIVEHSLGEAEGYRTVPKTISESHAIYRAGTLEYLNYAHDLFVNDTDVPIEEMKDYKRYMDRKILVDMGMHSHMRDFLRMPEGCDNRAQRAIFHAMDVALNEGAPIERLHELLDEWLQISTLFSCLSVSRRSLFPHEGVGYRYDWDAKTHLAIGEFIVKTSKDYIAERAKEDAEEEAELDAG